MGRRVLELVSSAAAAVTDETEDYYWVRVLDRFNMYVMKNDKSVAPHLIYDGYWESWITQWFIDNVGQNTIVYDVGANTGYYSMLALHLGANVMSFEPNPPYYQMLLDTSERMEPTGRWNISNLALSDKDGTALLHVPADLHGSASFTAMEEKWNYEKVLVNTARFDSIVTTKFKSNTVIKVDAEGAEELIWRGMENNFGVRGKPTFLLEYTPGAYSETFLDDLEAFAPLRWINHDGREEDITREWIARQEDWFMMVLRP